MEKEQECINLIKLNDTMVSMIDELMGPMKEIEKDLADIDPDNLQIEDAYKYRTAYLSASTLNKHYTKIVDTYKDIINIYQEIMKEKNNGDI